MPTQRFRGITRDRPGETLSGAGTLHRVNGIAIQARHFGPNLPPPPGIGQTRTKKRSIDPSVISAVPPYNAGDRWWSLM